MSDEEMQNNPRATVQQVYDQIMSDLNQAAELLAGFDNGANKDQLMKRSYMACVPVPIC